jgi:cytochrome c
MWIAGLAAVAAMALGLSAAQAADADAGQKVFKRSCGTCHTTEPGKNRIGPSLHGVVGRTSGAVDGFKYSEAMKNINWTWDNEHLNQYLENPKKAVPGNKMIFVGLKKEDDRANLIAYLDTLK